MCNESNNLCMVYCVCLDLGPAEHKAKFISNGDSILLPCAVNTSNKIYPVPDSIEWRKDDGQLENGVR